jgi:hypothetical protein
MAHSNLEEMILRWLNKRQILASNILWFHKIK